MKINKVIILLLIGCLASTMLVGCSKKSNDNEANSKIENVLENTFGNTGEVKEDTSKEDKKDKKEDKTKVNTKEKQENKNEITKNKEETKKSKTKKTEKQNTKKENKDEEIKVKKEQQDKTDEIYDEDDNSQTCVVCGEFVPVSSMCECDGTIHHEYCKHHIYHCPNCRRKSTSDPYVYGCAWCGWTSDEEEYDVDTTDNDGEDIED